MNEQSQVLDLNTQGLDELQGKIVVINDTPYELGELLGSGGEAFVYKLRNCRTGLSQFALKVHRFLPGAPEFEELKRTRAATMFFLAALSASSPDGFKFPPIEIYDQNGGLLGLQRLMRGFILEDILSDVKTPRLTGGNFDEYEEEMIEANKAIQQDNYAGALTICDQVLALNPNHTEAIKSKSLCLFNTRHVAEAVHLMMSAIELEPNDTTTYSATARYFLAIGWPEAALNILTRTLSRYAIDFETWYQMTQIAIENDLVEEVLGFIEDGMRAIKDTEIGARLSQEMEQSRERSSTYQQALATAFKAQMDQHWKDGLTYCSRAVGISKRNIIARLNQAICHFHLSHMGEVIASTERIIFELRGVRAMPAIIITFLAAAEQRQWSLAKRMALLLVSFIDNPYDLPTVPILASEEGARERGEVAPILTILKMLPRNIEFSPEEGDRLQAVVDLYMQLGEAYGEL